jgi:predicted amidohydrolase
VRSATTGSIRRAPAHIALAGAELVAMPICFSTYSDPAHRASIWEVPLRARAYENGVFVLAANRVGIEGPRHHLGRSMLVDPRGTIVAEAGTQAAELLVATHRSRRRHFGTRQIPVVARSPSGSLWLARPRRLSATTRSSSRRSPSASTCWKRSTPRAGRWH